MWYFIVVLNYLFLMTNGIETLFMCMCAIQYVF